LEEEEMKDRRTLVDARQSEILPKLLNAQNGEQTISVDQKLKEQFQFFREEFLTTAAGLGVAVPVDITDDKSGLIQKFLVVGGPKYVYQIIQSAKDQLMLLRAGLSLLNTIMIFLRRMIPETLEHDKLWGKTSWSPRNHQSIELQWVYSQLIKVCDVMNVSALVFMFISTPNAIIQELLLSLLSNFLASSDEAIVQILQGPTMFSNVTIGNPTPAINLSIVAPSPAMGNATEGFSRPSLKRMNSRPNNTESADVNSSFRLSRSNTMSAGLTMSDEAAQQQQQQQQQQQSQEELNTCLSYILSVVLMQKNNHLLLSGLADVVISMTLRTNANLCEVVARTPTCLLPLLSDGGVGTGKSRGKGSSALRHAMLGGAGESLAVNPLGTRIVDWAGLKILLKFLQNYHSMFPCCYLTILRNKTWPPIKFAMNIILPTIGHYWLFACW
jgi:hypothetical protein